MVPPPGLEPGTCRLHGLHGMGAGSVSGYADFEREFDEAMIMLAPLLEEFARRHPETVPGTPEYEAHDEDEQGVLFQWPEH